MAACVFSASPTPHKKGIEIVVIDPGHGGKDPGAVSSKPVWNQTKRNIKHVKTTLMEKDVVLSISKRVVRIFKEKAPGIRCILTRTDDRFVSLKDRLAIANRKKGDLFISIHANSVRGNQNKRASVNGYAVYFLDVARSDEARAAAAFENSVLAYEANQDKDRLNDLEFILKSTELNLFRSESEAFAILLEKEMDKTVKNLNRRKTGISQAGFYVLRRVEMPAVLLETAFISNPKEAERLGKGAFQETVARAIFNAVLRFK